MSAREKKVIRVAVIGGALAIIGLTADLTGLFSFVTGKQGPDLWSGKPEQAQTTVTGVTPPIASSPTTSPTQTATPSQAPASTIATPRIIPEIVRAPDTLTLNTPPNNPNTPPRDNPVAARFDGHLSRSRFPNQGREEQLQLAVTGMTSGGEVHWEINRRDENFVHASGGSFANFDGTFDSNLTWYPSFAHDNPLPPEINFVVIVVDVASGQELRLPLVVTN